MEKEKKDMLPAEGSTGDIVIFKSEDGSVHVDVVFSGETVWLTIDGMCELFGKARSTINEHILNIYQEGELREEDSIRKIGISDFSTIPKRTYPLLFSSRYRTRFTMPYMAIRQRKSSILVRMQRKSSWD